LIIWLLLVEVVLAAETRDKVAVVVVLEGY
jgi:hypothetical protein